MKEEQLIKFNLAVLAGGTVTFFLIIFGSDLHGQPAPASPENALAWSKVIGQIFDAWWERVILIISLLGNLGLLTKAGRQGLKQAATAGQIKPK